MITAKVDVTHCTLMGAKTVELRAALAISISTPPPVILAVSSAADFQTKSVNPQCL